jgi:hypothetical protein
MYVWIVCHVLNLWWAKLSLSVELMFGRKLCLCVEQFMAVIVCLYDELKLAGLVVCRTIPGCNVMSVF